MKNNMGIVSFVSAAITFTIALLNSLGINTVDTLLTHWLSESLGIIAILLSIFAIVGLISWLLWRTIFRPNLKKFKEQYPGLPVVNIMYGKKSSHSDFAMYYIFFLLVIYNLAAYLDLVENSPLIIYITLLVLLVTYLNRLFLKYRINQGFYANNRSETEEIIQFILDESSNIDFTDDGHAKKILSEKDVKDIQELVAGKLPGHPVPA